MLDVILEILDNCLVVVEFHHLSGDRRGCAVYVDATESEEVELASMVIILFGIYQCCANPGKDSLLVVVDIRNCLSRVPLF